jgi:hypothetical protein
MNASEQRALPLLLRHPVLLASPMLGAAAFNFVLWKIASGFDDHFFREFLCPSSAAEAVSRFLSSSRDCATLLSAW